MMQRPDEVKLSREEGEAWIERLAGDAWSADDRRVLVQVLQVYLGLLFALQEAKFSLKRLRPMLLGAKASTRKASPPDTLSGSSDADGDSGSAAGVSQAKGDSAPTAAPRRPSPGRQGAKAYVGAERIGCRHEAWAVGARCPVWGQGRL